jgi:uncharacterized protein (DUF2342 family)
MGWIDLKIEGQAEWKTVLHTFHGASEVRNGERAVARRHQLPASGRVQSALHGLPTDESRARAAHKFIERVDSKLV